MLQVHSQRIGFSQANKIAKKIEENSSTLTCIRMVHCDLDGETATMIADEICRRPIDMYADDVYEMLRDASTIDWAIKKNLFDENIADKKDPDEHYLNLLEEDMSDVAYEFFGDHPDIQREFEDAQNNRITEVDFSHNRISYKALEIVQMLLNDEDYIGVNPTLKKIDLSCNGIPAEVLLRIVHEVVGLDGLHPELVVDLSGNERLTKDQKDEIDTVTKEDNGTHKFIFMRFV